MPVMSFKFYIPLPSSDVFKETLLARLRDLVANLHFSSSIRAAVVHLILRAGSTFPVPVCTVSPGLCVKKADTQ